MQSFETKIYDSAKLTYNELNSISAKLDAILESNLIAALQTLEQAKNSETEKLHLFREARQFFNQAINPYSVSKTAKELEGVSQKLGFTSITQGILESVKLGWIQKKKYNASVKECESIDEVFKTECNRMIVSYVGLAFCHFALDDKKNGVSALSSAEKVADTGIASVVSQIKSVGNTIDLMGKGCGFPIMFDSMFPSFMRPVSIKMLIDAGPSLRHENYHIDILYHIISGYDLSLMDFDSDFVFPPLPCSFLETKLKLLKLRTLMLRSNIK